MKASLTIVGTGIKFLSHITHEAKIHIEQSKKVLYLVNDPVMAEWIQKTNANAESLNFLYSKHSNRLNKYQAITEYILQSVRNFLEVCVVFYGHPSIFCKPALDAVIQAKNEGIEAKILPGISAEACLFSDLLIDPGSCGCSSFEATDFLIHKRQFDSCSHLILWQADVIGMLDNPEETNITGLLLLRDYLLKFYPPLFVIFIYEAALYPIFEPRIEKILLKDLPQARLTSISTLYVPPCYDKRSDAEILKKLQLI